MSELNYINKEDAHFYENESGLLMLKYKGEDFGRVSIRRIFPLKFSEEYLSVARENYARTDKNDEIGIIRDLKEFDREQSEIVRRELDRRYFLPEVTKVISVTEEFGNTTWKVETTAGSTDFTVEDMSANIIKLSENTVILIDVFSNRYLFKDIKKLGDKTVQALEIWI